MDSIKLNVGRIAEIPDRFSIAGASFNEIGAENLDQLTNNTKQKLQEYATMADEKLKLRQKQLDAAAESLRQAEARAAAAQSSEDAAPVDLTPYYERYYECQRALDNAQQLYQSIYSLPHVYEDAISKFETEKNNLCSDFFAEIDFCKKQTDEFVKNLHHYLDEAGKVTAVSAKALKKSHTSNSDNSVVTSGTPTIRKNGSSIVSYDKTHETRTTIENNSSNIISKAAETKTSTVKNKNNITKTGKKKISDVIKKYSGVSAENTKDTKSETGKKRISVLSEKTKSASAAINTKTPSSSGVDALQNGKVSSIKKNTGNTANTAITKFPDNFMHIRFSLTENKIKSVTEKNNKGISISIREKRSESDFTKIFSDISYLDLFKNQGQHDQFDFYIKNELAARAPIKIPNDALIAVVQKGIYEQVVYVWIENGYEYTCRWHTPTSVAHQSNGITWRAHRRQVAPNDKISNPLDTIPAEEHFVNGQWIPDSVFRANSNYKRDSHIKDTNPIKKFKKDT